MREATERRSSDSPRIPIDVPIEIMDGDYSDPVEADALSLGLGGLSMRAAYLPDLGSKLTCRFSTADGMRFVEVVGEVVWAENRDPHMGEFGVRFTQVDGESRDVIRDMITAWGDLMTDHDVDSPQGVGVESSTARGQRAEIGSPMTLQLEGVSSPVVTTLVEDGARAAKVEQALPFLRLGRRVTNDQDGRSGILSGVSLRLDGDMPRLVLGVDWDAPMHGGTPRVKEDTLHDFEAPSFGADEAFDDAYAPRSDYDGDYRRADQGDLTEEVATDFSEVDELGILIGDVDLSASLPGDPTVADEFDESLEMMRPGWHRHVSVLSERLGKLRGIAAKRVKSLLGSLGPALAVFWGKIKKQAPLVVGHMRVWVRKVSNPLVGGIYTLLNTLRLRLGMKALSRHRGMRRQTSQPRSRDRRQARPKRRQGGGRQRRRASGIASKITMVLALIGGLGLGAYALFAPGEAAEAEAPLADEARPSSTLASALPAQRPLRIAAPVVAEPEPLADEPPTAEPAEVAGEATPEPVVPPMPTALPEASRQAGPLGAEGADTGAEASGESTSARSFGAAEVADGRSYRLRMSLPIQSIRGERIANGFRIEIPESLALDRAGPIAASHPSIERAMILNRGDHSELTIRFVEGRDPAYRVEVRGATLELTIGR